MAEKDLAQNAVERLSEDEALRGDLSDIGFGPLLDWATAAVTAFAAHATTQNTVDQYTDRVRGVVQSAVADADAGKIDTISDLLDFDPADKAGAEAAFKVLKLSDDSDQNAVDIAGVLQAALKPASSITEAAQTKAAPSQTSSSTEAAPAKPETATATQEHTEVPTMGELDKIEKTSIEPKPKSASAHAHTEHKEVKEAKESENSKPKESEEPKKPKESVDHKQSKEPEKC